MNEPFVVAATIGPSLAGLVWLLASHSPILRQRAAGTIGLLSHAAAWAVFWLAFRGDAVGWQSLQPSLLGATVAVAAELGIALALIRADSLRRSESPAAVVGLSVATSAVVALGYSRSLPVTAVFLLVPTLVAAVAAFSSGPRPRLAGVGALLGADVVGLIGLSLFFGRGDSVVPAQTEGLSAGAALLLLAAAVKAGAIPRVGTWRLAEHEGALAAIAMALRGQGVALAGLASLELSEPIRIPVAAAAAAIFVLAGGVLAASARRPDQHLAALCGLGASLLFLGLGLGGPVGAEAFLILSSPFLLAAGAATMLSGRSPATHQMEFRPLWRGVGVASSAIAVAGLLGAPGVGTFPGMLLTVNLTASRAQIQPMYLLILAATAFGVGLAAIAAVGRIRRANPRPVAALAGAAVALTLIYMGSQPVRLAIGWLSRVKEELGLPEVLASSGAPGLPGVGGRALLLVVAPTVVGLAVLLRIGRGVRTGARGLTPYRPLLTWEELMERDPTVRPLAMRTTALIARFEAARDDIRRAGLGLTAMLILLALEVGLALRILVLSSSGGFL